MKHTRFSRREFAIGYASTLASTFASTARAQGQGVSLTLAREFKNSFLLNVSADGKRICLAPSETAQQSFVFREGGWQRIESGTRGGGLGVVELTSWKVLQSAKMRDTVNSATFFDDGLTIYAETVAFGQERNLVSQQAIIDIASGALTEHIRAESPRTSLLSFTALTKPALIGTLFNGTTKKTDALLLVKLPVFEEQSRAPFAIGEREQYSHETRMFVSADRNIVVYGYDRIVICRQTHDLRVLWVQEIPLVRFTLAVTADGRLVAVAINHEEHPWIQIYDGKVGRPVTTLPSNQAEGIAISPDGRLLAVGERVETSVDTQPTVHIHELPSGRKLTSVIHDRLRVGRGEYSKGSFGVHGIQFTSDGKYLLTSTIHTKVWALGA